MLLMVAVCPLFKVVDFDIHYVLNLSLRDGLCK